jgi:hypothetical protein
MFERGEPIAVGLFLALLGLLGGAIPKFLQGTLTVLVDKLGTAALMVPRMIPGRLHYFDIVLCRLEVRLRRLSGRGAEMLGRPDLTQT